MEYLTIFVVWTMFIFLSVFRFDYRVALFSFWFVMITEWPCLTLIFCEITFNRKTSLTIYECQAGSHPSRIPLFFFVFVFFCCRCCYMTLHYFVPDFFWLLLFISPFLSPCPPILALFFCHFKRPHIFLISPFWYNLCIKCSSPRSFHSCLLLKIQLSTQELLPRGALPISFPHYSIS